MTIAEMQRDAHKNSVAHGWWEEQATAVGGGLDPRLVDAAIPEKLCLIHSEVSEALEEYRNDRPPYYIDGATRKPEGLAAELADVIIRIGDLAGALGVDLEQAVVEKMAYNAGRPHRHGGKRC